MRSSNHTACRWHVCQATNVVVTMHLPWPPVRQDGAPTRTCVLAQYDPTLILSLTCQSLRRPSSCATVQQPQAAQCTAVAQGLNALAQREHKVRWCTRIHDNPVPRAPEQRGRHKALELVPWSAWLRGRGAAEPCTAGARTSPAREQYRGVVTAADNRRQHRAHPRAAHVAASRARRQSRRAKGVPRLCRLDCAREWAAGRGGKCAGATAHCTQRPRASICRVLQVAGGVLRTAARQMAAGVRSQPENCTPCCCRARHVSPSVSMHSMFQDTDSPKKGLKVDHVAANAKPSVPLGERGALALAKV